MSLPFATAYPLKPARAHEVCGDGGLAFTAMTAGQSDGPVVWVCEARLPVLNPEGLAAYCDPGKLLITRAGSQQEVLASMETALRSGAAGLVAGELTAPIGLTEGRRLQLAAEAGGTTALLLIPEGAGSNAAETRWRCTNVPGPNSAPGSVLSPHTPLRPQPDQPQQNDHDSTHWRWSLIKNKIGTLSEWVVRWDAAARRVIVVSEAGS